MNSTIEYYNKNAKVFCENTVDINMMSIYNRFLQYVPNKGRILDAGCGSGRDCKAFLSMGYEVEAFDASPEICKIAHGYTGVEIINATFEEYITDKEFDAVWACASLLHVKRDDIGIILNKLESFLKYEGILYASFKKGNGFRVENGKYYADYMMPKLEKIVFEQTDLKILEMWESIQQQTSAKVEWINIILKREKVSNI